ncbi:MAG: acyl carrier protein [Bryobacteraceae bacterium]
MQFEGEAISDYVLRTLGELASDWDCCQPIGEHTLLFRELGLESLDVVVLGTAIQQHYRRLMPFAEFLATIGQNGRSDLSVGELVAFVEEQLNNGEPQRRGAGR